MRAARRSGAEPTARPSGAGPRERAEVLGSFARHVYGRTPPGGRTTDVEVTTVRAEALGGRARLHEMTVTMAGPLGWRRVPVLLHVPVGAHAAPVVVGLNFSGNHTTTTDPGVTVGRDAEAPRGSRVSRWPHEAVLARGYAVATAHYADLEVDEPGHAAQGVRGLFPTAPAEGWGAIGAWAWGLSRILDALGEVPGVDPTASVVIGHSRLGKAALWAGAQDERFAVTVSNDSGCGGAALYRHAAPDKENVAAITSAFPHWFTPAFAGYAGREHDLPVDADDLLALIAPRALHVASAVEDAWADPLGEYLATVHASAAYEALGQTGTREAGPDPQGLPPLGRRVGGRLSYHVRAGGHDLTAQDWDLALDAADAALAATGRAGELA